VELVKVKINVTSTTSIATYVKYLLIINEIIKYMHKERVVSSGKDCNLTCCHLDFLGKEMRSTSQQKVNQKGKNKPHRNMTH
jgi:hypothetical protein